MSNEVALTEKQENFIQALVENGGNVRAAAEQSGITLQYAYIVKSKLAERIAEATMGYLALSAPRAARKIVDSVTAEMPNPINLSAAKDVLDRIGVRPRTEEVEKPIIKQNIFILPEKRPLQMIDIPEEAIRLVPREFNERS